MAARENQGLFIAVILLVLLSVVLAVLTYFGFTGMQESSDRAESLKTQLNDEEAARKAYEAQAGILKSVVGVESETTAEIQTYQNTLASTGSQDLIDQTARILQVWEDDMAKAASDAEGTDLTYRKLIEDMVNAMGSMHARNTQLSNEVEEKTLKLETELAAKDTELAQKDKQLQKAQEDLKAEEQRHEATRTELTSRLDDAEDRYKKVNAELQQTIQKMDRMTDQLKNEIAAKDETIMQKDAMITRLTATETDVADGQIISVAPQLGKVTINLGSRDNLRLKQTFAVYDQDVSSFRSGEGKAMIEVTNILDDHLAEARITSQDPTDPILARDFVSTATWDPGYSVPVAIAGRIDLDGDGFSDLQRLISIVEHTGYGTVVAYHDEEGNVVGDIDERTRFFVKGKDPLGPMVPGYNRLDAQRERYQTRVISVQEFLNEMGYRSEAKIQRFDDEEVPEADSTFQPRKPGTPPTTRPETEVESGDPFDG